MQIGFVGLGKMGGNMVHRIERDSDHEVVAFDPNAEAVSTADRGMDLATPVSHHTLAGVLLLSIIGPGLVFLHLQPQWEKALQGLIILLAVAADGWRTVKQKI